MSKKALIKSVVILTILGVICTKAISSEISFFGDTTIVSDYVWRGQLCDDDPSIQTGLYLSGYNLSLSLWTSHPLDGDDSINCEEVDYSLEYGKSIDKLGFAVGYIYYDFPNAGALFVTEVYGKVSLDVLLSPSVTYYNDFTDKENTLGYISIDGSYNIDALSFGGHLGLYSNDRGSDILLSSSYEIELLNSKLTPSISYSIPRGKLDDTQDAKFFAGLNLSFEL